MKELLLSEISSEVIDPLQAIALIEEFIFAESVDLTSITLLAQHCKKQLETSDSLLEQAEQLINEVFIHQLFIDKHRTIWTVASHKVIESLAYRVVSPVLKSVLLKHIIAECGFDVEIVFVPEKIMIRILCDDDYAIVFDPITGESLSWHDLDARLADSDNAINGDFVQFFETQELIQQYITSLKTALIQEQKFAQALKCVDVLLAMRPDDPFERRDRGFLLHQLDCFKVAYDDYRYFVEQCPKDPQAQLLKYQLDNIFINDIILH
ncbi:MAG: tetratricopeptide repeat protein [Thalassotalea sp.]